MTARVRARARARVRARVRARALCACGPSIYVLNLTPLTPALVCCREHASLLVKKLLPEVTILEKRDALSAAAAYLLSKGDHASLLNSTHRCGC